MRALIRLGRDHPTPLFAVVLATATLFSLTTGQQTPVARAPRSDNPHRIVVNSPLGTLGAAPGKTTLADALAQAAKDPSDNIIQFDLSLSPRAELVIRQTTPLVSEGATGGQDTVDASDLPAGLVLDLTGCPDAGFVVGAGRQLTLANLTLRGSGQRTILLKDNAHLTLQDVTIRESRGPGLAAFGQACLTATRCRFLNNKTHAIELHGDSTAALELSSLQANGQSGLAGFDRATATLKQCRLDNNAEWNAVLTHSSRVELESCTIRQARFAGLDLSESAYARLRDCSVEASNRFGLFITGTATAELTKTRLSKNAGRGIELQEQSRLALRDCVIEDSGEYGLILFGNTNVTAANTLFAGNGAHGASVRGTATSRFTGCAFTRNRFSGLGCLDAGDGGKVQASQCLFHGNGMRPIYRGPLHLAPLVPTPLAVNDGTVECMADPNATVELFLDRGGEAGKYLRTIRADAQGRFEVSLAQAPDGFVITATATSNDSTSEFNVVAGSQSQAVLSALLGRTGPYSDAGGNANFASIVRRWKSGTKIVFQFQQPPTPAVERYTRFLVARVGDWTHGEVEAEVRIGNDGATPAPGVVIIPVRYTSADSPQLLGLGGVTYMKWDAEGYFQSPMEILLAQAGDPEETCPRVLAHEVGHALGLSHTRVGLLSRMQGKIAPGPGLVNDFSPMLTYYDVLALQILHDPRHKGGDSLREIMARTLEPRPKANAVVDARPTPAASAAQPSYSPSPRSPAPKPKRTVRRR